MAKDRSTRIAENDVEARVPDGWELDADGFTLPNPELLPDRDAREVAEDNLASALYEATVILRRIGGVVSFAPVRRELAPGIFVTEEFAMRWNSFSPPVRDPQPVEAEAETVEQAA